MTFFRSSNQALRKAGAILTLAVFLFQSVLPVSAQSILNLPQPGAMIKTSAVFAPAIIKGLTIHPENPLRFDFIIDTGEDNLQGEEFKTEAMKLIKYFLAALTVPEEEFWVNLSPYEKDRIIPGGLGTTELGRDLLAQDYILKQITASLIFPEDRLGSEFWRRVYDKAQKQYGTTDIPIDTFNKVWIVPDKAVVYERQNGTVFVGERHLKVMLEQDYLALEHESPAAQNPGGPVNPRIQETGALETQNSRDVNALGSEIVREIILPELEKEVNEGKNFAPLRQIYNSMILATWYKKNLKESLLGQVYMNKNKVKGVDLQDRQVKQKIYDQYLEAFQKGVYNYIREDIDFVTNKVIPRKYFSGGYAGTETTRILQEQSFPEGTLRAEEIVEPNGVNRDVIIDLVEDANVALLRERRAAIVSGLISELDPQLPFTFSRDSRDTVNIENWPSIEQVGKKDSSLSAETKQLILLALVKNNNFNEEVRGEIGIIQAIAYFRQLHPNKRAEVLRDLKLLGYLSTAQWLDQNKETPLADLYEGISKQFGIIIGPKAIEFVLIHDRTVRRARGLRLTLDTVSGLSNISSKREAEKLLTSNQRLQEVVFGLRNAAEVILQDEYIPMVTEMFWGLKQAEGINLHMVRLGKDRFYVYEEHVLKKVAQDNDLSLATTIQGLEHLIKIDMARSSGVFFELLNGVDQRDAQDISNISEAIFASNEQEPLATWDQKEAFWRATPLAGRIFELEKTEIETTYIATINREVALRTQLESEAEANLIFNRKSKFVIVDDSSPEILAANKKTLADLYERYGLESWHITPEMREKEFDQYAKDLTAKYQRELSGGVLNAEIEKVLTANGILQDGVIDGAVLRQYLVKNVFFHISGVRNRTVLKAKGESVIMSMDDDAPPETYVVKKEERDRIRNERLQAREVQMKDLMREVGEVLGVTISNEEDFYFRVANVDSAIKDQIDEIVNQYFGYDPVNLAGKIPLAMDEIKITDEQLLDQDGWGRKLGISHQRYHGLMTPFPRYILRISDFTYPRPRTEKKQGQFDVLPVNVYRMGNLVGKRAGDTNLPLMGSPLDGRGDLRGTMGQPIEQSKRDALANKTVAYVAAPFVEDQDTSGVAHFIRYLQMDRKKAANLQHANQSALLVEGILGFIADTYVIFNRAALSNGIVSPSIGRDLRLEEPPYILWVKSPMMEGQLTVAYSHVAGGQQREIAERMYDVSQQDYTEVVGVIARATYERAVKKFYEVLESRPDLQGEGKHYERLRVLGAIYTEEAKLFQMSEEQRRSLLRQREIRAMMLGELSKQKAELQRKLEAEPDNQQLAQEIRDINLIFVQYAQSFAFYQTKDQKKFDYGPQNQMSDYFYRIRVMGQTVHWERVQPSFKVETVRGITVAQNTQWLTQETGVSGDFKLEAVQPEQLIEVEAGSSIVLSQRPQDGDEFIIPAITISKTTGFIDNVYKKASDQVRSDGELMIVWPDLVDVAIPWREEANKSSDEKVIQRFRELSAQTTRLKQADAQASTPLRYDIYQNSELRVRKGVFSLQLIPERKGKRPSQYAGEGIRQDFNPDKFNYNKVAPAEVISEDQIGGMSVTTIVNVSPFAEGHFLLVPERSSGHPQYLDRVQYLEMVLERMTQADRENFKITYNSLGAFSSINHLHFQAFYYGGDGQGQALWSEGQLPVERSDREEIVVTSEGVTVSRVSNYSANALAFKADNKTRLAQEVFKYVSILNQRNIAYNILISKNEVIVMPRKYEFANALGAGTAVLEMAGEFIAFDQETVDRLTEEDIRQELAKTTIDSDLFDATLKEFTQSTQLLTAVATKNDVGGIDFNSALLDLQIKRDGNGVPLPTFEQPIETMSIEGFFPVIISDTPSTIQLLLSEQESQSNLQLSRI